MIIDKKEYKEFIIERKTIIMYSDGGWIFFREKEERYFLDWLEIILEKQGDYVSISKKNYEIAIKVWWDLKKVSVFRISRRLIKETSNEMYW